MTESPEAANQSAAPPTPPPLVVASGLRRDYQVGQSTVHALAGIDVTIAASEAVAIVGRSGSGKSTLLNVLGGLERPSAGSITVAGHDLGCLSRDELAVYRLRTVGFVFQSFHLVPHLSVLENVALPMMIAGVGWLARRRRAKELLERTGLSERMRHRPTELSGGERQRVAVARALANEPKLLLADEPTGNLDTKTAGEIMGLIREERTRAGAALVLVTHERDVAHENAERMIELQDGAVLSDRPTAPSGEVAEQADAAGAEEAA